MKHLSILVPDSQTNMSTIACIVGAVQVFGEANTYWTRRYGTAVFKVELLGAGPDAHLDNNFLSIRHQLAVDSVQATDLILIPASQIRNYETATTSNQRLIDWVSHQYKRGAEVASMCAGSFMLASTGLLSGRPCSTHWALAETFRAAFPEIQVQSDRLITDEGGIYTNGGAYSFLHLLMYLAEKYYDRQTAIHCAKYFQIDLDRHSQAGFAIFSGHKKHGDDVVLTAQRYIENHYAEKISFERLSAGLGTGRRNFDRRFIRATGLTPLDYLQRVRIEHAKKSFESARKSVNEIMYDVGYNDAKAFRDVFSRVTGLSPLEYRVKYGRGDFNLKI